MKSDKPKRSTWLLSRSVSSRICFFSRLSLSHIASIVPKFEVSVWIWERCSPMKVSLSLISCASRTSLGIFTIILKKKCVIFIPLSMQSHLAFEMVVLGENLIRSCLHGVDNCRPGRSFLNSLLHRSLLDDSWCRSNGHWSTHCECIECAECNFLGLSEKQLKVEVKQ